MGGRLMSPYLAELSQFVRMLRQEVRCETQMDGCCLVAACKECDGLPTPHSNPVCHVCSIGKDANDRGETRIGKELNERGVFSSDRSPGPDPWWDCVPVSHTCSAGKDCVAKRALAPAVIAGAHV